MSFNFNPPHLSNIPLSTLYNLLQPITVPKSSPQATFTNWGLTFTCQPLLVFEPTSEYQCALILELAKREGKTVRAVGVGHSPSDLACTSEYMLRTSRLNNMLEVRGNRLFTPVPRDTCRISRPEIYLFDVPLNPGDLSDAELLSLIG